MVQIIPGNTFPWDTLGGVIMAVSMMIALYKRRMFRLTLLVSKNVVLMVSFVMCTFASVYFISPVKQAIVSTGMSDNAATSFVVVIFFVLIILICYMIKRLMDSLFTREEQQSRLLKAFSNKVSRTLKTEEVFSELIKVVTTEIPVCNVYFCLPEEGAFVSRYSSNPLKPQKFSISAQSPLLTYLRSEETCFTMEEFRHSPYYLSLWQDEKKIFRDMDITASRLVDDEIYRLLLLSSKEHGRLLLLGMSFSHRQTITSKRSKCLSSTSAFRSANGQLTEFTITRFYRVIRRFEACRGDSLALFILDLDDFKALQPALRQRWGDYIMRRVAEIAKAVSKNALFSASRKCSPSCFPILTAAARSYWLKRSGAV